jgi:hypothetical protein
MSSGRSGAEEKACVFIVYLVNQWLANRGTGTPDRRIVDVRGVSQPARRRSRRAPA